MPANRIAIFVLPLLLCLGVGLRADTIFLKSGEKLEGRILSETDTEITISVQVTATIKDERLVKKADIDKVHKILPDMEAWAPLSGLALGADSLEREDYSRITAALEYFITSFPESSFVPLAKERLAAFAAELKRVDGGEMKMDGQWLSKEKVLEERIQMGGHILFNRMKRAVAAAQLTEAMGIFDHLEKGFIGSASYPDAVELARQVLPPLKVAVEQKQAQHKRRLEDEKQRLLTAKGTEKDQLTLVLKNERATAEAAVAAFDKAGVKWYPLQPVTERSLSALISRINSEGARLNGLQIQKMRDSMKSAETAAAFLANGDMENADKALMEATSAWSANELAKRLRDKIAEMKKDAAAAKAGRPKPTPTPAPKPPPSASVPSAAPATISSVEPAIAEEPLAEPSLFRRPVSYIVLAAIVAGGVIGAKAFARFRSVESR